MATRTSGGASGSDRPRDHWTRMLAFGSLFGSVAAVLLLGAALGNDGPSADPGEPLATSTVATALPGAVPPPAPRTVPVDALARRVAHDRDRLSRFDSSWTAQLAVLCDPARAQDLIDRFGSAASLYLLPAFVGDDACFRVCWNRYESADSARDAADLPAGLRAIQPEPLPRRIAEVIE